MSATPDHAFVVLAHKQAPFLESCLASVRNQTLRTPTHIVTSTPNEHIHEQARLANVDVIVNEGRSDQSGNFNFALRASGTRFVTLAHEDDLYQPTFVEQSLALFERRPEGALTFTGYREIFDDGRVRHSKITVANRLLTTATLGNCEVVDKLRSRAFLGLGCAIPCSSVTFDMKKLDWFNFSGDLSCCFDWEGWWRIREQGLPLLRVKAPLVHRRYNDKTQTAAAKRDGRRQSEDLAILRSIWPPRIGDLVHRLYSLGY